MNGCVRKVRTKPNKHHANKRKQKGPTFTLRWVPKNVNKDPNLKWVPKVEKRVTTLKWVPKASNQTGPKLQWVPKVT